jgi:hypothetical protein
VSSPNTSSSGGSGFFTLLFLLFLGLRLAGVIDWPWIWVFAPIWGPLVFALLGLIVLALCGVFNK